MQIMKYKSMKTNSGEQFSKPYARNLNTKQMFVVSEAMISFRRKISIHFCDSEFEQKQLKKMIRKC